MSILEKNMIIRKIIIAKYTSLCYNPKVYSNIVRIEKIVMGSFFLWVRNFPRIIRRIY